MIDLGLDLGKKWCRAWTETIACCRVRSSPDSTMSCGECWSRTRSAAQRALNNSTPRIKACYINFLLTQGTIDYSSSVLRRNAEGAPGTVLGGLPRSRFQGDPLCEVISSCFVRLVYGVS